MNIQPQKLSLGYPAAVGCKLFRSREGIISQHNDKFVGLLNYPTTVEFSGKAIRKMNDLTRAYNSTIKVYAKLKFGKKITLFSINSNCFSRVQFDRKTK